MPFLTNVPLPQCLQHSSATRCLLARDHDRGCTRYLLEVKCLAPSCISGGSCILICAIAAFWLAVALCLAALTSALRSSVPLINSGAFQRGLSMGLFASWLA